MREVDLSQIPYIERNGKKIYQWEKAIGLTLPFVYDEHEGEFTIVDKKKDTFVIRYNGKDFTLDRRYIISTQIEKIFPKKVDWQYDIGTSIVDEKRDLIITGQIYDKSRNKGRNYKFYTYKCNVCGFDSAMSNLSINEIKINEGKGCACCAGKIVIRGINDIATTHPELIDFLVNEEDAYTYSYGSKIPLEAKCNNCGKPKPFKELPNRITSQGYSCPYCTRKKSYPERFLMSVLDQAGIEYVTELSNGYFKWCKKYRYDFYLEKYNTIIETHGMQHYETGLSFYNIEFDYFEHNDEKKKQLALENGIDNYIELDCRFSTMKHIRNSIEQSVLKNIIDLSSVDYSLANKEARYNKHH